MSSRSRRFPLSTYRLQFHRDFTFADAAALVPYLHRLGVSHCYASPLLKARPGSSHGYDIVDHGQLNPDLGERADFEHLVECLHRHGMGLIVDIVPNHMGVGGADNAWWRDVLENGPAAEYAEFFDIDWRPAHETLRGKILLPLLGEPYGEVLDKGEIKLVFEPTAGAFHFAYYEHHLPLDPVTYPEVAAPKLADLHRQLPPDDPGLAELENLLAALTHLPGRESREAEQCQERRRDKEITKQRLSDLCRRDARIATFWRQCLDFFNLPGDQGPEAAARRGERLHQLLELQAYRLAHWVVAGDEINYRRFFDINSLAGLQAEREEVFAATHGLLLQLVAAGQIDGLRVDHPDGLSDPAGYFSRLQAAVAAGRGGASDDDDSRDTGDRAESIYLVVEKILAAHEYLPEEWQVHGTTGYDFANQVNGLLVKPDHEAALTGIYHRFIGRRQDFDDLLYRCKKKIITGQLASELTVLARLLKDIAESDRHTRDYTLNGLREALIEVVAAFPVYRTYIVPTAPVASIGAARHSYKVSPEDRRQVEWALAQAGKRSGTRDGGLYDFIRALLLDSEPPPPGWQPDQPADRLRARFIRKFQQYTAPVMAKALEDTAFYVANRLVSLNEVGGDPRRFYLTPAAFHHAAQERLRRWPLAMLATSTHDSKRSEDVRARINVLSEVPALWRRHLKRWRRLNRSRKSRVNSLLAPTPNDEYLLYQTLLGSWPLHGAEPNGPNTDFWAAYRRRIQQYMGKAIREAKERTSWLHPDQEYEAAVDRFVEAILSPAGTASPGEAAAGGDLAGANPFLADFIPLANKLAPYGLLNALAQLLLKLTSPGVPDIYQGTETWDFSLVDPDNRRPVDYHHRRRLLAALPPPDQPLPPALLRELADSIEDGRLKLLLTSRLLHFRRQNQELLRRGSYLPLTASGERGEYLCAFVRQWQGQGMLVATGRWFATLATTDTTPAMPDSDPGPLWSQLNPQLWRNTRLLLPANTTADWQDLLTGTRLPIMQEPDGNYLTCSDLFANLPMAVLHYRAADHSKQ
ncbi:malto-oligosyltrehalose synthase [Desulfurivibrio alkaliphilus]|uniref:Malto-oligosyltrehalose synthase n=1 Tax=Desulfurivibrio alkaliphilus (strain DSM 19089 / UNIQEM U267 / AHT2) TaxID=589865 RepID=D6Z0F7_DESAT|nr:malto-oligosyltrehalose synthase [Desulfurivibrio alkaliphilus]ADH85186.1 malto-oligosyltrehalose synthase [Desulfurivibrio alkaliphilus AHT 2]